MNDHPQQPDMTDDELLEQFLDGQLSGDLESAAQTRLAESPEWQAAAALQRRIDDSLQRQHSAPPLDPRFVELLAAGGRQAESPLADALRSETPPADEEAPTVAPRQQPSNSRSSATQWVAAALVLICCGLWAFQSGLFGSRDGSYAERMVAHIYQTGVEQGFQPDWLCEDEQRFAETFDERLGQPLLLKTLPEDIQITGIAYWPGFTPDATCLLMRVEGEPVLVIVDRSRRLPSHLIEPDPTNGISVHTRVIGRLTAIEISPFDQPRTLEYLIEAQVPTEPTGRAPGG